MKSKTAKFISKYPETPLMTNCLIDLACPQCGSREGVTIEVKRWASISDNGTDDEPGDTEYKDRNPCRCTECEHEATVAAFTFPELDAAIEERRAAAATT